MSENIGDLSITIRVNKQTGELDVIKGQVTDTGKAIEGLGHSSVGSSEQLTGLVGSITKLASATAVLAFLKQAIAEATDEAEALRHLKAQMDALGLSFDLNRPRILQWTEAMVQLAHIEDDVVLDALSKVIQRTGDLSASMKIVQLSQDIAMATGRDFSLTLENLSAAAGGSSRGLSQLQIQFGQQVAAANSAKEAIQILANNYGGAAEKAKGLAVASADATISMKEMYSKIGKDLTPALEFLSDNVVKRLVANLTDAEIWAKTTAATIVAAVVGVTAVVWTSIKSVGSVLSAFYRDDWTGFETAIKTGFTNIKTTAKEQMDIVRKVSAEGITESAALWEKGSSEIKGALQDLNEIPVGPGKQETQAVIEQMNRRIDELRRQEAIELADKMLTNEEKIAVLERYASAEIDIITETKAQIGDAELRSEERIQQIKQQSELRKKQISQQGFENLKQGWLDYYNHANNIDAQLAQTQKKVFDDLANAFGQSTAKMIVQGASFTKTFESLFRNMAEQVIAQIVAMIAKWAILNAISAGSGGGSIGFLKAVGLAEGGRVYNPTYALIGEGGEPESVVPDSKAKDFARGVLAGGGGSGAASGMRASAAGDGTSSQAPNLHAPAAGGGDAYFGDININVTGVMDFNDPSSRQQLLRALAEELKVTCSASVAFARRSADLAERYRNRAV